MSTSVADIALDLATPGKKGTARKGFHLAFRQERFVSSAGIRGVRNHAERCTCSQKYNHAA